MLALDDFQRITLDDKAVFDQHFTQYPPTHSGTVFTTMISWQEYVKYYYVSVDNNLIVYTDCNGVIQFRPPIGSFSLDLFNQVLEIAKKEGSKEPLGMIDLKTKNWMLQNTKIRSFTEDRNFFDYVYLASDLANLQGTEYAKIRNRLNKFKKNFSYSLEAISEQNMDEVADFLKRWCLWKDCASDEVLEHERKAILFSMKHFFALKLHGLALRIDNAIEAITVFEQINPETVVVHFEKGSPDFDGVYKAINMETAQFLEKKIKFINRQEDMGIPGLRQAKMSYRPHHFVEVFHIQKDDIII